MMMMALGLGRSRQVRGDAIIRFRRPTPTRPTRPTPLSIHRICDPNSWIQQPHSSGWFSSTCGNPDKSTNSKIQVCHLGCPSKDITAPGYEKQITPTLSLSLSLSLSLLTDFSRSKTIGLLGWNWQLVSSVGFELCVVQFWNRAVSLEV